MFGIKRAQECRCCSRPFVTSAALRAGVREDAPKQSQAPLRVRPEEKCLALCHPQGALGCMRLKLLCPLRNSSSERFLHLLPCCVRTTCRLSLSFRGWGGRSSMGGVWPHSIREFQRNIATASNCCTSCLSDFQETFKTSLQSHRTTRALCIACSRPGYYPRLP